MRRITLGRPDAAAVCLVTDLLEAEPSPATERVAGSRLRWGSEAVVPQVTAVFPLQALIGTTPHGPVLQWAFWLLLYNLLQVVRADIAAAQARPVPTLSLELRVEDGQRHLMALSELVVPPVVGVLCDSTLEGSALRQHLERLLAPVWTPRWLKAPPPEA